MREIFGMYPLGERRNEMISRDEVFEMVAKERDRQDAKWGFPQHNSPFEWVSIVTEELGEL